MGVDDVMVAWDVALWLASSVADVLGSLSLACRVLTTGASSGCTEPSDEALSCSLEEVELTRLLVSVSVSGSVSD